MVIYLNKTFRISYSHLVKKISAASPIVIALRAVTQKYIPYFWPTFGWLLRPPIQQKPSKSKVPSLSIFFSTLKSPPKMTRKRPTHTILPVRVSYQTPPLPTAPSFCSYLCRPNERRPSKTGALPISDDCRWRRRQSADNGGNGNVDSGAINGRQRGRRGRRRTTAAEDIGGDGGYEYTSSARFVYACRNSIPGK